MKRFMLVSLGGVSLTWLLAGCLSAQAASVLTNKLAKINTNHFQEINTTNSRDKNLFNTTNFSSSKILNKQRLILASDAMDQVTSVSQLSDVQPTDWAFQALQSLVERYGCIAGYPNGTFRGNRALTRYEFAAGLNACLNRVNELIATSTADIVKKGDLATLQKLQEQFSAELATLRGRVDNLEARTAQLQAAQFSTTTKLSGEVIFAAIGAGGGARGTKNPNVIVADRVRLNLTTSFTGKDALITGLQAYNFLGGVDGSGSVQKSLGLASPVLSSSSARTSFEPLFPGVDAKNLGSVGANSVELYKLLYVFPVAKKLTLFAGTAAEVTDAFPTVTPFYGEGQESISRFGSLNPVLRVSGGTSETGLASAAGFIYSISKQLDLRALYGSVSANIPQNAGFPATPLGGGVFNGSDVIATQLTFTPSQSLQIGLNYANSYHQINILGTGLINSDIGALAGVSVTTPVSLNSVGGTVTFRFSPKVALSGYGAAMFVNAANTKAISASTTFTSWMVGLHFNDLFKTGNAAGILFGQPLYRSDASGSALLTPAGTNRATPYHLEAYYRFQVGDHISVTPGAFVLFNPEGDSRNSTTTVGVLRTTFTF